MDSIKRLFILIEMYKNRYFSFYQPSQNASQKRSVSEINLDCGRPVSFSFYDDLIGISQRYSHPLVPDETVNKLIKPYHEITINY